MWQFLFAALILGFSATYVVPFLSGLAVKSLPQKAAQYLPPTATPALGVAAFVSLVVYGALLAFVLVGLSYAGVRTHVDGIEA